METCLSEIQNVSIASSRKFVNLPEASFQFVAHRLHFTLQCSLVISLADP